MPPKFHIDQAPTRPLDEYLRAGSDAMRDGVLVELRLPESGRGPVELLLHRPGDLTQADNRVYLDPSTARVLTIDREADRPLGARLLEAFTPVRCGQLGGAFYSLASGERSLDGPFVFKP
jgi:hypothetical protein